MVTKYFIYCSTKSNIVTSKVNFSSQRTILLSLNECMMKSGNSKTSKNSELKINFGMFQSLVKGPNC